MLRHHTHYNHNYIIKRGLILFTFVLFELFICFITTSSFLKFNTLLNNKDFTFITL